MPLTWHQSVIRILPGSRAPSLTPLPRRLLNFFVAIVLTLAGIIWFIVSQRRTTGAQPAPDGEPVPGRVPGSR